MPALITGASNAAAFRLARLFAKEDLVFGSNEQLSDFGSFKFITIPLATSPSFCHELLKICLDNQINEIFPLLKIEIIELASSKVLFEEFNIKIIAPSINFINLGLLNLDKSQFKVVIIKNSEFIAGDLPPQNKLPKEGNGIFYWEIVNDKVTFSLFAL
jgi:hypothetical protein